jgi:hypothetical protein
MTWWQSVGMSHRLRWGAVPRERGQPCARPQQERVTQQWLRPRRAWARYSWSSVRPRQECPRREEMLKRLGEKMVRQHSQPSTWLAEVLLRKRLLWGWILPLSPRQQ